VLHLAGLKQIGDHVKALGGEGVAGLPERRGDVLGHGVPPRSERLEDRTGSNPLGEPHDDRPKPVWNEQYDEPRQISHAGLANC